MIERNPLNEEELINAYRNIEGRLHGLIAQVANDQLSGEVIDKLAGQINACDAAGVVVFQRYYALTGKRTMPPMNEAVVVTNED